MTTTITSSSSSSLVSLLRLVALSLNATRSHSPVGLSMVLGTWACLSFPLVAAGRRSGRGCRCRPCWAFAVIRLAFVCWALAVGCRSLSSLRAVIESLGGGASFWAAGVIRGGGAGVTWHAGDMEGARSPGDMGVWLSGLVGRWSWFVGGVGCWSWWRLLVGGVVAWRSHGG